jgi:PAS domain S-box-containing protein
MIHILHLEDDPTDAELQDELLRSNGFDIESLRVDTQEAFVAALEAANLDVILADYTLPGFNGLAALEIAKDKKPKIPFIFVSGTLGEEIAIESLRNGATDYVVKQRLNRLAPVIRRAFHESEVREAQEAAEANARRMRDMFQALTENAPDGVALIDREGNLKFVSPAGRRMFGYDLDESPIINLVEHTHPEDQSEISSLLANLIVKPGQNSTQQYRFKKKEGEWLWIESTFTNLLQHPNLDAIVINFRDISERKLAEARLRYQAELLASVTDIIVSTDLGGTIQSWNKAAERAFGYSADEAIGRQVNEIVRSEYLQGSKEEVDAEIREKGFWNGEVKAYHRNGSYLLTIASVSMILDEKGNPIGFLMMDHDISERKRSEDKIHQQLQRLTALRRIDEAIAGSLDIHLVLDIALNHVISELDVDAAAILLFDPLGMDLSFEVGKGFTTTEYQKTRVRIGEGYAGRAALERRTIQINDLRSRNTDVLRTPTFAKEGFHTYLGIPLIAKGEIKGVLEIFNRDPMEPDEEWLNFMETLAGQIAIAIDSTTLFTSLQRSNINLIHAYDATIEGWSKALDLRDKETEGHTLRVVELTIQLARAKNLSDEDIVHIRRGALLHDIGKMGVPDQILLKPGALTEAEWEIMGKHPTFAHDMLAPISYLQKALDIPYCHHEKWDGTGYPQGLNGGQIPLAARLFSVVDVYDALTSDRPYRPAWSREQAMEYIKNGAGKDFDPQIVELFLQIMDH